jgi:hypothetical protein
MATLYRDRRGRGYNPSHSCGIPARKLTRKSGIQFSNGQSICRVQGKTPYAKLLRIDSPPRATETEARDNTINRYRYAAGQTTDLPYQGLPTARTRGTGELLRGRAEHIVTRAQEYWTRHGRCTPVLSRILVYHHAREKDELEPTSAKAVEKAVNYFLDMLGKNHGMTPQHLRTMLLPLGIGHDALDTQLTAALQQLARKRGQFAHASFKAHQPIDPKTERDNIQKNIFPELKKLDRRLTDLA